MMMSMTSTHMIVFLYFIPLVFIGAYFMLNLTLAVINYKFNEAHKFYQEKKRIENAKKQRQINNGGAIASRTSLS